MLISLIIVCVRNEYKFIAYNGKINSHYDNVTVITIIIIMMAMIIFNDRPYVWVDNVISE